MLSCHALTDDIGKPKVAIVSKELAAPIPIGLCNSLSSPFSFLFFLFICPFIFFISLPRANAMLIFRSIAYWEGLGHYI